MCRYVERIAYCLGKIECCLVQTSWLYNVQESLLIYVLLTVERPATLRQCRKKLELFVYSCRRREEEARHDGFYKCSGHWS